MNKNKTINYKGQRGAASALVIFTVFIFVTILMGVYGIVMSKAQAQIKSDERIRDIYEKDVDRANRIYNELISEIYDEEAPNVSITLNTSEDYLFAVKANVTVTDNNQVDFSKCKYIFTNSNTEIGNDISLYTEGDIIESNTIIEKPKSAGTYYLHVLATDVKGNKKEEISNNSVTIASEENYSYKAEAQEVKLMAGDYKFECWGASAYAVSNYGYGGYTAGNINLDNNKTLYIYTGQEGGQTTGGFNGGGSGRNVSTTGYYYGGGATDIRIVNGTWNAFDSLKTRIMVAAGGGISTVGARANAGGLTGYNGINASNYSAYNSNGGTQTAGGTVTNYPSGGKTYGTAGGFGYGGTGGNVTSSGGGYGGGSGYYGGAGSSALSSGFFSSAGGSSFISGHAGCNAIAESSTSSSITHTGQANHYSGLVFTETKMIDGAGYNWTTTKGSLERMPNPAGGQYASNVGHSGNGVVRITNINS